MTGLRAACRWDAARRAMTGTHAMSSWTAADSNGDSNSSGQWQAAAASGRQQRPATAHHARKIRANWGYVRPEKREVGGSTLPLTTSLISGTAALVRSGLTGGPPGDCRLLEGLRSGNRDAVGAIRARRRGAKGGDVDAPREGASLGGRAADDCPGGAVGGGHEQARRDTS